MLKRLEQEALSADLMAVESLLSKRDEEEDPVGWLQFSERKARIEEQLAQLSARVASKSVALLFGGRPVVASRGIAADFSATIISNIQSLISTQTAASEGPLGERGPVPQRDKSQMLITDVARGSFGFVLEDADRSDAGLSAPIEAVCDLLVNLSSVDDEKFFLATESVDTRVITPLKTFFKTLDDYAATVRVVSDTADFDLDVETIQRARARIDTLQVGEPYEIDMVGRIFTIPDSKRFELFPLENLGVIKGGINVQFVKQMFENDFVASRDFNGKVRSVRLSVRETRHPNGARRKSYALMNVSETDYIAPPIASRGESTGANIPSAPD